MYKRNLVFTAACLGMLLFGVVLISLGSLLPSLTKKFVMDEIAAGSLATLLPFGILAGSVVFGPVVDRYGHKSLLIICSLLVLLGLEGIAFTNDFLILQISVFITGIGGGALNGGTNALVSDISSEGKGANLSLLGVFFGVGALGMPAVLGILSKNFSYEVITAGIGLAVIIPVVFFIAIKFPVPKQPQGLPVKQGLNMIKDPVLLLFAAILFFESGMEGIVSNWTTTFLIKDININPESALFSLSYFILGLTLTRLLLGGLLKIRQRRTLPVVLYVSVGIILTGSLVIIYAVSYSLVLTGLILLGIGFAAVFPVVLGYVGEIYSSLSGTAFSIVLVIALIGNMFMNFSVGIIAQSYGIKHFTTVLVISLIIMTLLLRIVLRKVSPGTKKISTTNITE
jgi:MFS family permease